MALVWALFGSAAPAAADAAADREPGRETAPGQVKKVDEPEPPVCPEGEYPNNDGGCSPPMCPDGTAVPESGECAPGCADGSEICETRSCPVDLPLPPGALCEDDGGTLGAAPQRELEPNPIVTTVTAAEKGGGSALGPAAQGSVFGRPAEVLGVTLDAPVVAASAPALPAVAATGAETTWLALLGVTLVAAGAAMVRGTARENSR